MEPSLKTISKKITVMCARAASFPAGIMDAFKQLETAHPDFGRRQFYGLSRGKSDGGIEYWAAVEQHDPAEVNSNGLQSKTISAGTYSSITIRNFRSDTGAIGEAFGALLKNPRLDRDTWCVEIYSKDHVECMVRLTDLPKKSLNLNLK